ncbi:arrestin domain-containing protein 17-like [Maniola hyperantus]|uniref:arrestin domain-containing protein 17-like n=1 Tax=Aphantopus hyperantus TaxID=2795564 RepID=UPI0015698EC6|nr:arrestin domain-containing protein 17-like [Maniola hyperantus]
MGLDDGQLELNSPNGTYYPGQTVQGKLIIQQDKVKIFRGIYVKLKGFCYVHWTTRRSKTVNGKKEYRTINHSAHEEYINYKVYLVGGESGERSTGPGKYEYPFQFRLPNNCPASFEGQHGHIRYEIKAVVDGALQLDQEEKIAVRVVTPVDLNLDPYCREPIELQMEETYRCCCISSGACDVAVNLPVSGYCPGQTIPVELVCNNKGRVEIKNIKLSIMKQLIYIATSKAENRINARNTCGETVVEIKKGPIPARTNRNWTVEMEVPAMDAYDLTGCEYIKLEYKFKVIINPKGCHSDTEDSRRIVIGTVPLVGYQDNIPNPLQDQLPQPIPEKSSYPSTINEGNPPFPNPEPYPGNSQYPPANSYPNDDKSNSPYPPNSSSYPSSNPLYPDVTPYMDNPPPYPGNLTDPVSNPPYPAENPPYPNEKSPFLDASSPTSGAKVDPGSNSPSGGSGRNLPLLSPNSPVSPRPASPFATASAPAPDSPDSALPEKKD